MAKFTAPEPEPVAVAASPTLATFFFCLRHSACPTTFVKVEAADEAKAKQKVQAHWPGDCAVCGEPDDKSNLTVI